MKIYLVSTKWSDFVVFAKTNQEAMKVLQKGIFTKPIGSKEIGLAKSPYGKPRIIV